MTIPAAGSVFISYRREDTSHLAGRLYDRLAARFGDANVFMDVDTLDPGVDFAEAGLCRPTSQAADGLTIPTTWSAWRSRRP
jgi:hypothetical protein